MIIENLLSNISWKIKTFALCGFFLLMIISMGCLGGYFIYYENQSIQRTLTESQIQSDAAANTRLAIVEMNRALQELIAVKDRRDIRRAAIASIKASSILDENLHNLSEAMPNDRKVRTLNQLLKKIKPTQVKIIKLAKRNDDNNALKYFREILSSVEQIETLSAEILNNERQALNQNMASQFAQGRQILSLMIGIVIVAIIIGVIVSVIATRMIVRPLRKAAAALEGIADGDLDQSLAFAGTDEIGRMSVAFNKAVASMRTAFEKIEHAHKREQCLAQELQTKVADILDVIQNPDGSELELSDNDDDVMNNIGQELDKFLQDLCTSIKTIADNANVLHNSAGDLRSVSSHMSDNAEETSGLAKNAATGAEQISTNVQSIADGIANMQTSINAIARNTQEASLIAGSAVKTSEESNIIMQQLRTSSEDIDTIVALIGKIADQTNMLSLNATIEAARAGEAGKGFAVVANEVKDLAKETTQATKDIRDKVDVIQQDIQRSVKMIAQIGEVIEQISIFQTTITESVEQQISTSNEISFSINEAANDSSEVAASITRVSMAADHTSEGARSTQEAALTLSNIANELNLLVTQFKFEKDNQEHAQKIA